MQKCIYSVPTQNNGTDCGVFVCRYAYNMVLMQDCKFTPGSIVDVISHSPAFKFGMKDISRIRKELSDLISNISLVYLSMTSTNDDVASTISDLVILGDEVNASVFAGFEDHGRKQKKYKSPYTSPHHKQSTKCPSRQPSPTRQPFNRFGKNPIAQPEAKHSKKPGRQYVTRCVVSRNAKNMHLTIPKKNRSVNQNKERKVSKQFELALRSYPVNDTEIDTLLASSIRIPESQNLA